jgi:hypothetical protein
LDIEQNELVSVAVQVRFEIVCCKAHEICVFSKMETERICRQVSRGIELEFFFDDGDQDIGGVGAPSLRLDRILGG